MMRAPLFTERRARIVELLRERPGSSKTEIARELGQDVSSVDHHLRVLEKRRVVVSERAGRAVAFFVNGTVPPEKRRAMVASHRIEAARVLEALRSVAGWQRCCDLAERAGLSYYQTRNALRALERIGLARRSAYAHWEAIA